MAGRVWLLNLILLVGIVYFTWQSYLVLAGGPLVPPPPAEEAAAARTVPPKLPELPPAPPMEEYASIERGNLFTPGRAPLPPAAAAVPPSEIRPPVAVELPQDRYALYGVVRIGDNLYRALIRDKKAPNAKTLTFAVGDSLGPGQVVKKIEDKRVLVGTLSGDQELRLRAPKGAEDTGFVPKPPAQAAMPASHLPVPQVQPQVRPVQPIPPRVEQRPVRPETGRKPLIEVPPEEEEEDTGDEFLDEDEEDMLDMGDEE